MAALRLPLWVEEKGRERWQNKNTLRRNMGDSITYWIFIYLERNKSRISSSSFLVWNICHICLFHSLYRTINVAAAWREPSFGFFCGHPAWAVCAGKSWSQIHNPYFMTRLDVNTGSWTRSFKSPGNLRSCQKGSSSQATKNPRTQATCCFSNKTTATQCRSHNYSSALWTRQGNISTDPDKGSPSCYP